MKIVFCILTIIIFMVVAVSVNQTVNAQSDNFKTYTNKEMKFTIEHPSNWKIEEDNSEVDFKIREKVDENPAFLESFTNSLTFFRVSVEEPETDLNTDTMTLKNTSLIQRVNEERQKILGPDSKLIRETPVTVDGNNGSKIEYRVTNKYFDRYGFVIVTSAEGKFYFLNYFEQPLKVPDTLPLANKMVESFQIK